MGGTTIFRWLHWLQFHWEWKSNFPRFCTAHINRGSVCVFVFYLFPPLLLLLLRLLRKSLWIITKNNHRLTFLAQSRAQGSIQDGDNPINIARALLLAEQQLSTNGARLLPFLVQCLLQPQKYESTKQKRSLSRRQNWPQAAHAAAWNQQASICNNSSYMGALCFFVWRKSRPEAALHTPRRNDKDDDGLDDNVI